MYGQIATVSKLFYDKYKKREHVHVFEPACAQRINSQKNTIWSSYAVSRPLEESHVFEVTLKVLDSLWGHREEGQSWGATVYPLQTHELPSNTHTTTCMCWES